MKPQIIESIMFIESVVDVWNDLKDRYFPGDIIHVLSLYQDILNFKQGGLKVFEYFTKIIALGE